MAAIREMVADINLAIVRFGDHLLMMNAKFDMTIAGEPYHARTLLFNLKTGRFLSRLWSRTVSYGCALRLEDLREECEGHFRRGKLCLGLLQGKSEQEGLPFHVTQTPVPRRVSKSCRGMLSSKIHVIDDICESFACEECIKLRESVALPKEPAAHAGMPKTYSPRTPGGGDLGSVGEVDMAHDLWLNQVISGRVGARNLGGSSSTKPEKITVTPALCLPATVGKSSTGKKTCLFNMGDKSNLTPSKPFT